MTTRQPITPGRIRHCYRIIEIAPFGPVHVSWWVAAGLAVGVIFISPRGFQIVPLRPRYFKDYETLHLYCTPRPYSFYFYSRPEDLK